MAVTIQFDSRHQASQDRESYLHYLARESRVALRWIVMISAAVTAISMMTFPFWAILPALVLLVSYCLLLVSTELERRTRNHGDPSAEDPTLEAVEAAAANVDPAKVEKQVIAHEVHHQSFKTIIRIVLGVAALALLVVGVTIIAAGSQLGRELLFIGAMAVFAYMLLVAAPLWLGWVEDEAEEEQHRVEEQIHSSV